MGNFFLNHQQPGGSLISALLERVQQNSLEGLPEGVTSDEGIAFLGFYPTAPLLGAFVAIPSRQSHYRHHHLHLLASFT